MLLQKRFGSKFEGEWNFLTKKNKTGGKFGLPKKGNEKLYQQIVNYVKGQHGPNFAFDAFDNANYHLVQMHRATNLKVPNPLIFTILFFFKLLLMIEIKSSINFSAYKIGTPNLEFIILEISFLVRLSRLFFDIYVT